MIYVVTPRVINREKLASVKAQMRILGRPKIKAYWDGHKYLAIEGSHRIAAAYELGLEPIIVEVNQYDTVEHDLELPSRTVADLVSHISNHIDPAHIFSFDAGHQDQGQQRYH